MDAIDKDEELERADEALYDTVDKVSNGLDADAAEYDPYMSQLNLTYKGLGWWPSEQSFSEESLEAAEKSIASDISAITKAFAVNQDGWSIGCDCSRKAIEQMLQAASEQVAKDDHDAKNDPDAEGSVAVQWVHGYPKYFADCAVSVPVKVMKDGIQLNESGEQFLTPFQQQVLRWTEMLG